MVQSTKHDKNHLTTIDELPTLISYNIHLTRRSFYEYATYSFSKQYWFGSMPSNPLYVIPFCRILLLLFLFLL